MIPIALRRLRLPVLLGLVMQCAGCSTQRPVLYPNEHYTTVGDAVAQGTPVSLHVNTANPVARAAYEKYGFVSACGLAYRFSHMFRFALSNEDWRFGPS